ncbi:shikimate dehydrogenase [Thalassotalea fusca]
MKLCVFGNPIQQSRSPDIHHHFAQLCGLNVSYEKCLAPLDAFESTVRQFIASGGKGGNVTVPFKEEALALCSHLSDRARAAGAVNTLSFINGEIHGDNTDGIGLVSDLLGKGVKLENSRILLIGAGGAARGVVLPILAQQPESITIINRTVAKAQGLVAQFNDTRLVADGLDISETQPFDIVINATSASLTDTAVELPEGIIANHTICYDMVYGSDKTAFMQYCEQKGACQTFDGLGMLVGQAAESFNIWTGCMPDVQATLICVRNMLAK